MIFQPRSLQQRTLLYILFPTFLLLTTLSVGGFVFIRNILLNQWGEVAIVKLERTAHLVDMELQRPKELLLLLQGGQDSEISRQVVAHVIKQIEELKTVVAVNVDWPANRELSSRTMSEMEPGQEMKMMSRYRLNKFEISLPQYNIKLKNRTVSMVSEIKDKDELVVGRVEVVISFDKLIEQVINAPWWTGNKAYLVGPSGNVLASTSLQFELEDSFPMRAFGTVNTLEKETLLAMQEKMSGVVAGPGSPPEEISGFYHLNEAPWTMVIIAPGEKVLQPIIQFRMLYFLTFAGCILLILIFIRLIISQVTTRIKAVSSAADDLARGNFGPPLSITTRDEVSELARSFNKMSWQLQQRLAMKREINIAREVQQNLLPQDSFSASGIVAAGYSLYCDETGGDYFDIITFPENDQKVSLVVGDVVGHGIGAALLMTTVRSLIRCRVSQPGSLDQIIADVNSLLWQDTSNSGSFVTLFYLEIDRKQNSMRWVRCGHDPAMVYSPADGLFTELNGKGLALGVDTDWRFEYNELPVPEVEQLVLIGSDGAWEVQNARGEQFGKERIRQILATASHLHPEEIIQSIIEEITAFRGSVPQDDDITLVVVKTG